MQKADIRNSKKRGGKVSNITSKDSPGAKILDIGEKTAAFAADKAASLAIPLVEKASTMLLGDPSMPQGDRVKKLVGVLKDDAAMVSAVATDPDVKKQLGDISKSAGEAVSTMIEVAKPGLEDIEDEMAETLEEVAEKSAVAGINTGLNVTEAVVAEIPVVGGLLDLGLAAGRAFTSGSAAVAPLIEKSGDIAATAVGTATEAMSATEKSQQEMSSAVEGLNQTMEKIQDKAQQAASGGKKKKKGSVSRRRRRNTVKQQKAAAKRTMKRIKKSMRRFFRTGAKTKTKRRGRRGRA
jgi:Skp family chaperone for outer membrane proteins